jgi:hypothetical protein
MLMVGQQDEAALGMFATMVIGLAAQHTPTEASHYGGARFYVLDGSLDDSPHAGYLARLEGVTLHEVKVIGRRELPDVLSELAGEVERRQQQSHTTGHTLYLLIYGLHRFRDLRRSEDDFSFSRRPDDKPNPAEQFGTLLKEGPGLGIHTIVWCDSLNNLNRSMDRQTLREFELRVLFQMSAGDSSTLIDSPAASKLGVHRAFFESEEQGRLEKFRPYGLPSEAWLEFASKQLKAKGAAE